MTPFVLIVHSLSVQEVERQMKLFLESCDFYALKYDDVISVLRTIQM